MNFGDDLGVKLYKTNRMQGDCSRLSSLVFLEKKLFLGFGYGSPKEDLEVGLMNFGRDFGLKTEKTIRMQADCSTLPSIVFLGNSF